MNLLNVKRFPASLLLLALLLTLTARAVFGQAVVTTASGKKQTVTFPQTATDIAAALPNPTQVTATYSNQFPQGVDYFGTDNALISEYNIGYIHQIRISDAQLIATIDLFTRGYRGKGAIAVAPDRSTALAQEGLNLYVIPAPFDASAASRTQIIQLPGTVHPAQTLSVGFDPQGRAFVYHNQGISVLSPPYSTPDFTIPFQTRSGGALAVTRDGQQVLASDRQTPNLRIFTAPFDTLSRPVTLSLPGGSEPDGIAISPDNQKAIVVDLGANKIYFISAPFDASSTVTRKDINDVFEDVSISADGQLAMACGGVSGTSGPVPFIRPPFDASAVITNVNIGGRGGGGCRFLPPGLAAGLTLAKTGPASVGPGSDLTYTLTYGNTGSADATGVVLRDTIPTGATFVSATGNPTSAPAVGSAGEVVWDLGTVPANTPNAGTVTLTVNVAVASGKLVNGTYRIADSGGQNVYGPPVETRVVDRPPVAQDDSYPAIAGATTRVDAAQGVLANDSDPDHNTLGAVKVSDPAQGVLTLDADGAFTYDATGVAPGTYTFTYKANDGQLDSNVATVTLVVAPANQPPHAAPDSYTTAQDTLLAIDVPGLLRNDTDPDGNPLQLAQLPGQCSDNPALACTVDADCGPQTSLPGDPYCTFPFDITPPAHGTVALGLDGRFTYIPDPGYSGSDNFAYKVTDGQAASAAAVVKLRINAVNRAPLPIDDRYPAVKNVALQIAAPGILANDVDPDGDALQPLFITQPTHGVLQPTNNGGFIYTPNHNYVGLDSFTYQATDGAATSSPATVILDIVDNGVNTPPTAQPDSYTVPFGAVMQTPAPGLLANDSDPDGNQPLRVVLDTDPSWQPQLGAVQLTTGGGFTYTPFAAANCTADQTDTFRYYANDGVENSKKPAVVTVTIHCANQPPVGQPDLYSTPRDTELVVAAPGVLANDLDPDGNPLRAVLETDTTQGALALQPDGSFRYQPGLGFTGADTFTYRVTDGGFSSAPVTVTITVNATNRAPLAADDAYRTLKNVPLTVKTPGFLTNDLDPDGDALNDVVVDAPQHGSLHPYKRGGFTYTPAANYIGLDRFTYRATDGQADSGLATVVLEVADTNSPPVAQPDAYPTPDGVLLTVPAPGLLANDSDPDGNQPLSVVLDALPTLGTVHLTAGGGFDYQPTPTATPCSADRTDTFTYFANDGIVNSTTPATVTLNIHCVNQAPVAQPDAYSTPLNTELVVPAAGVLANDADPDGNLLRMVLVTGPTHGTLSPALDGGFRYRPIAGFIGTDTFTYRASDGASSGDPITVTILVTATNAPTLTAIQPDRGPLTGGTSITLLGTAFVAGATTVTVGGQPCGSVTVQSPAQLTCVTPAGQAGAQPVVVTTPGGSSNAGVFTYGSTTPPTDIPTLSQWGLLLLGALLALIARWRGPMPAGRR